MRAAPSSPSCSVSCVEPVRSQNAIAGGCAVVRCTMPARCIVISMFATTSSME